MRLSMECQATRKCLSSSNRGVQLRQHHRAQLPTVASNNFNLQRIETPGFNNNFFKDQNFLQAHAMRCKISHPVTSASASVVPRTSRGAPSANTCIENPSSMRTFPLATRPEQFVCALHLLGCNSNPFLRNASRSKMSIRFIESQLLATRVTSSATLHV